MVEVSDVPAKERFEARGGCAPTRRVKIPDNLGPT
jgi:hypothetical protein